MNLNSVSVLNNLHDPDSNFVRDKRVLGIMC